ncbi:hypothetical protein LBMAG56_53760 [Verrucomicrobiota bacterium]|nr:hypothetical protein LBMAG56_53760 [Verrucomicrobiota bacterium]
MTPRELELAGQLHECRAALAQARQENALLRQKLDALARRFFGKQSEQLHAGQLELLLQLTNFADANAAAPVVAAPITPVRRPPPERQPRFSENLPVVEEVLDPEPVKAAPEHCKRQPRCIWRGARRLGTIAA